VAASLLPERVQLVIEKLEPFALTYSLAIDAARRNPRQVVLPSAPFALDPSASSAEPHAPALRARLRDDRHATQPRSTDDLKSPSNWAGVAITARTQGSATGRSCLLAFVRDVAGRVEAREKLRAGAGRGPATGVCRKGIGYWASESELAFTSGSRQGLGGGGGICPLLCRGALGFSAAEDALGRPGFGLARAARGPSLSTRSVGHRSCDGVTRRSLPAKTGAFGSVGAT
jgi:hypothetical protein